MGHRLSRIVTKTGDDGTTGLGDGKRVPKDHARVAAYGTIDELNSVLGLVLAEPLPEEMKDLLCAVQNDLFDLGSELCAPGREKMREAHVLRLEERLTAMNEALPMLKEFILPGGSRAAAACHLARTVCRRAERDVVTLSHTEPVSGAAIKYINRLSDLLFVVSRVLNRAAGMSDVLWEPGKHLAGD